MASLGDQRSHPVGVGVLEAGAPGRAHRGRPSLGVGGYDSQEDLRKSGQEGMGELGLARFALPNIPD